jgi:hypothetical protein
MKGAVVITRIQCRAEDEAGDEDGSRVLARVDEIVGIGDGALLGDEGGTKKESENTNDAS